MTENRVLIVATSMRVDSRSRVMAEYAREQLAVRGIKAALIDLREIGGLPFAGSAEASAGSDALTALREQAARASHLLIALPVYNFAAGAAAKNFVELMSEAEIGGKTVGFLCSAGGPRAYMAVLGLANSLMLDFRCWIVPRFVYATRLDFASGAIASEDVRGRIDLLLTEMFARGGGGGGGDGEPPS